MKPILSLLAIAALGIPSTTLLAAEGPTRGDGQRAERKEQHAKKALTLADIQNSPRHQMAAEAGIDIDVAAVFAEADANGDGSLTKEEMESFRDAMQKNVKTAIFSKIDSDGSGELSPEELKAFHQANMERRQARREENGEGKARSEARSEARAEGRGEGRGAEKKQDRPSPAERFAAADTDGSGGLSLDEFLALEGPRHGPEGEGRGPRGDKERGEGRGEGRGPRGDKERGEGRGPQLDDQDGDG